LLLIFVDDSLTTKLVGYLLNKNLYGCWEYVVYEGNSADLYLYGEASYAQRLP